MKFKVKFTKTFFDVYRYKVCRGEDGKYQPFLKHKWGLIWRPLHEFAKNLPLMEDEIRKIERPFISNDADSFRARITCTSGLDTIDSAKERLNAFIHCVNTVINENSEPESGTLKEFLVTENI
jgi:hypothetical protein